MMINKTNFKGTDTIWSIGSEYATKRAQGLLKASRITGPPFLPQYLAPFQGVKQIVREDLGDLSGLLLPLHDGFKIKINATHSPHRQNFSLAHEIAHTFFLEEEGRKMIKRLNRENGKSTKFEEHLCDIAASEMLMPSQIFIKYASRYNFGIQALTPLTRIFNTSTIPTVLRLCDVNPRWCFIVHWAKEKSDELGNIKMRATWLTWSKKRISTKAGRFIFNPKLLYKSSSITEAYMTDSPTYSNERMVVGNFIGNCQIWSQGFETGPYRFVISMIFPNYIS